MSRSENLSGTEVREFANRVLRIIYELQFVGRVPAILTRPRGSDEPLEYRPLDRDPLQRLDSVPVLACLIELYQPSEPDRWLTMKLRRAVQYLVAKGLIRLWPTPSGEAETIAGFVVPLELAITAYFRPDGVLVGGYFNVCKPHDIEGFDDCDAAYLCDRLRLSANELCYWQGITVGRECVFRTVRPYRPDGNDVEDDDPVTPTESTRSFMPGRVSVVRYVLNQSADLCGCPLDESYVVTDAGISAVEPAGGTQRPKRTRKNHAPRSPNALTTRQWEVWEMHREQKLSFEEIGRRRGTSKQAAHATFDRADAKLQLARSLGRKREVPLLGKDQPA